MEDFRIVLMILGTLAISGLVIHGLWTVRKKNQEQEINTDNQAEEPVLKKVSKKVSKEIVKQSSKIQPTDKKENTVKERVEPNFDEGQIEMELPAEPAISIDDVEQAYEEDIITASSQTVMATPEPEKEANEPEEVLILNVVAPEGQVISGAALLPFLLTLGFKYGEMAIFHRHQDNAGSGEVLFSLANMFNPGTFDIDNMENFTSQGLSLFMSLPVDGDPSQVFNMMHNAAKKIAAEFNGQVLDGQRSVLTRQTVQHYVERIREFERRQLLKA